MDPVVEKSLKIDPAPADDAAILELVFQNGMANTHRLPIDQVIRTLREFQEMVREVGRRVQAQNGMAEPDGDFGLQLSAGRAGFIFRKGSLKTSAVATRDVANAKQTFAAITGNIDRYNKKPVQPASIQDTLIVRRLTRIGELQTASHTQIAIVTSGREMKTSRTTLGEKTWTNLRAAAPRNMKLEGLTLYGRLRQLNGHSSRLGRRIELPQIVEVFDVALEAVMKLGPSRYFALL